MKGVVTKVREKGALRIMHSKSVPWAQILSPHDRPSRI